VGSDLPRGRARGPRPAGDRARAGRRARRRRGPRPACLGNIERLPGAFGARAGRRRQRLPRDAARDGDDAAATLRPRAHDAAGRPCRRRSRAARPARGRARRRRRALAGPQPNERERQMTKALYTAEAHVTGGRADGHGRTSDGILEVDLRLPAEMGGQGGGTNPEELFAIGYAACFEGALGTVARRQRLETGDVAIDSKVTLVTTDDRAFTVAV